MKSKIKSLFLTSALLALAISSCKGNRDNNVAESDNLKREIAANAGINGKWILENIVFSDSVYVRPAEEVPGRPQYIVFEDTTYFIQTNCNTFSGSFTITGDSIALGDGWKTEMACDNMATEDALLKILPDIATIYIENDSIVRLDSRDPSAYIVLRKASADSGE